MKMVRLLIQLTTTQKAKLDGLREQGYAASEFIRHLLEREFNQATASRVGRKRV